MIDVYNDPYSERKYNAIKRREFERLKRTDEFKAWKLRQCDIQDYKCGWCKRNFLRDKPIYTDHVTPLRFEGKNEYTNFVLSCRSCNTKKWIANNRAYPEWVKIAIAEYEKKEMLKKQEQQFMDMYIFNNELSWI